MLSRIIDVMMQTPASLGTLAAHMQAIMSSLLQCLDIKMQSLDKLPGQSDSSVEMLILKIFQLVRSLLSLSIVAGTSWLPCTTVIACRHLDEHFHAADYNPSRALEKNAGEE